MENKLSLSIILPIKSSKAKDFDEYFNKAINKNNPKKKLDKIMNKKKK